jgi:signal transduction histidine kinase
MLMRPSLAGRVCARIEAGKRMIYRFRHGIIGPLAMFWLTVTVASVVIGAVAWSRFSRTIDASAEAEQFRESIDQLFSALQDAEASQRGYLLTGKGVYLEAFTNAVRAFPETFDRLAASAKREQAVREKSAFLANMSHEIRSPMNAILGFSELLEPEGLTPKQSQYVRAIRDSGASLLQLINDILDLSKLEAGKLELHPDPTDMRDSCEFLRTVFGQQAVMKSLQLQFELAPDMPRALLLDRLRLRQVLVNLLGNAIKFTERGCVKTRVAWQSQENGGTGTLLIDVEDTGIGILADKLEEIFKPFVQADARRTAEREGTGIGLTIVKRLIELMGGSLAVESTVGQGTVFHLRFTNVPVSGRLPVGDHAEPGGAVDFNDFAPAVLLVVDDNRTNRDLMAGIFEQTHHRVHFATVRISGKRSRVFPPLRPTRPRNGRNSLSNCAARRQPNGRRCVTAWRLMRREPLLTNSSSSARRRNAARWPLMPPRSPRSPMPTPSARWNVISPRSPNWLSPSKPLQPGLS